MKLSPELEARILAMPGVRVNGQPVQQAEVRAPVPTFADEAAFQSWVIQFGRGRGWECYHTFDSRNSEPGFPDAVLLREQVDRTRLLVAELKMPGKKPTAAQKKWLRLFELAGAEVFTWWPEDVPQIEQVLK